VGTPETALLALAAFDVGKPAVLQVMRAGRRASVSITPRALEVGKVRATNGTLGLSLRRSSRGAVVLDVGRSSAAERAGFLTGDVITSISGAAGVTPAGVTRAYAALEPGAHVVVGIERDGAPLLLALARPRVTR
jgi:S1-C subfamily serine protease